MATITERLDKHDREIAKHDRQIAVIRDLVREGIRLMVETRKDIRALNAMQTRTEANLQALINTMRRGGNGRGKGSVVQ